MVLKKWVFVGFTVLMIGSCGKEEVALSGTCRIEDPLNEIAWLDSLVAIYDQIEVSPGIMIQQHIYEGQCVFLVDDCTSCNQAIPLFDYDQNLVCQFTATFSENSCNIDANEFSTNSRILYLRPYKF